MAVTVTRVQDSRVMLGPGMVQESFLVIPGSSDYTTGGYSITASALGFKNIQSVSIDGSNSTGVSWTPIPVFAFAQVGSATASPGNAGYTSFKFYVAVITTGAQVASLGDLSGAIWCITVTGD